jgi:hypothetical protein
MGWIEQYWNSRKFLFLTRMYFYMAVYKWHFRFGQELKPHEPGLEVKFACEEAERQGAKLYFMGPEMNKETWQRLYHETRFNVPHYLMKRF